MGDPEWERAVMQGQPYGNTWIPRPKLEIPNVEPATPRRRGGATSAQSPRGIYDFPVSPQSPGEGMMLSPMRAGPVNTRSRPGVQDPMDQVQACQQYSPGSNHPGHGFDDCNAECSSTGSSRNGSQRASPSTCFKFGDCVLVRCNQTKWLVGQVRRTSSSSIKVWIGAAQTLVNVPVDLFPTHLARMDCYSPPSSPTESQSPGFRKGGILGTDIKARVQCVRPAHLSHRHLYQLISPANSAVNSPQTQQTQFASPRLKSDSYSRCFLPVNATSPSKLPDIVAAYFERERAHIPKTRSILKRISSVSEPVNIVKGEGNPVRITFDGQGATSDLQVQYSWRHHVAQRAQQGKRPSNPRPSVLPMPNVNSNNEGTQLSTPPYAYRRNISTHLAGTTALAGPDQQYVELPVRGYGEDICATPLNTPKYEQFVSTEVLIEKSNNHADNKYPYEPPNPSVIYIKGKEICEDKACPSWAKGTVFPPNTRTSPRISLQRSVSLDSFQSPPMSGLADLRSPVSRPQKHATLSAEPIWVTVIENGHGIRKL